MNVDRFCIRGENEDEEDLFSFGNLMLFQLQTSAQEVGPLSDAQRDERASPLIRRRAACERCDRGGPFYVHRQAIPRRGPPLPFHSQRGSSPRLPLRRAPTTGRSFILLL